MISSTHNLTYDIVLTELAALQNLMEKFKDDKKTLKELEETYDETLKLLEKFEMDRE